MYPDYTPRPSANGSPSTAAVTLDLGLDVHLALAPREAAEYASRRVGVLRKKREVLVRREERLLWEVEQVSGLGRSAVG